MVYAAASVERLAELVVATGAAGCALMLVAVVARRPSLLPGGLALAGGAYGLFLSLHAGAVDDWAPAVAATLFVAAELGFWSLEVTAARAERTVMLRRLGGLGVGALLTGLIGSLVLGLTTSAGGGLPLEAAGVAAAVVTLAAIAFLNSRASV